MNKKEETGREKHVRRPAFGFPGDEILVIRERGTPRRGGGLRRIAS